MDTQNNRKTSNKKADTRTKKNSPRTSRKSAAKPSNRNTNSTASRQTARAKRRSRRLNRGTLNFIISFLFAILVLLVAVCALLTCCVETNDKNTEPSSSTASQTNNVESSGSTTTLDRVDLSFYGNMYERVFYNEVPDCAKDGDIYLCGDYAYYYASSVGGWYVELATDDMDMLDLVPEFKTTDREQSKYDEILDNINGHDVVGMCYTFQDCVNMTSAPHIPSGVIDMWGTFSGCISLTGHIIIDANPDSYEECFAGTIEPIVLDGQSTMLQELANTAYNENVSVGFGEGE